MTQREIRFAINGFTSLVVISIAAALANLTWRLSGEANSASAVAAATDAYIPPDPAPNITALINLPPFGKVVAAPQAVMTQTDLLLRGVLLANPPSASTALIALPGGETVAYSVGDPLPGGLVLEGMAVDYVRIRAGAQYLTLYFPDDERSGQAVDPASAAVAQSAPSTPPASSRDGVEAIRALLPPSVRGGTVGPQATPPAVPQEQLPEER